ncbi:MAG: preprotein translocase subunit SecE [Ahniella sp.]|nr:preprotein translocase subunit SecE [Ahniella sp.]
MNAVADQNNYSTADKAKLAVAVLIAIAGCVGFALLSDQYGIWLRLLGLTAAFALAVAVVWFSSFGPALRDYLIESQFEMRKVVWPTRKESWQTTWVVFAMIGVIGLLLFIFDSALSYVFLDLIYGGSR